MRHRNLNDPPQSDLQRRVRQLESASPIGFSSVERGGLRIASDQGLLIEGQGLVTGLFDVTGTLSGSGRFDWSGPWFLRGPGRIEGNTVATGDIAARKFSAGAGDFKAVFDDRGLTVTGKGTKGAIGGSQKSFTYEGGIDGGAFYMDDSDGEGALFSSAQVYSSGLPKANNPNAYDVLLVNSDGYFHRGPTYGGIGGGDPDPGDPGDPTGTGLRWPFPLSIMTSDYGPRSSPGGVGSTFHQGIDFGAGCATPIPCAGPGTVIHAGWSGSWGNYIRVDHGDGVWTAYAHLSGYAVSVGQSVNQRQTLGYVGTTGASTGCHLHYEVWIGGTRVNPRGYTS